MTGILECPACGAGMVIMRTSRKKLMEQNIDYYIMHVEHGRIKEWQYIIVIQLEQIKLINICLVNYQNYYLLIKWLKQ